MTTHATTATRSGIRAALKRRSRTTRTIAASVGTLLVAGSVFGAALGANAEEAVSAGRDWNGSSDSPGTYTSWMEHRIDVTTASGGPEITFADAEFETPPFDRELGRYVHTQHNFEGRGVIEAIITNDNDSPVEVQGSFRSYPMLTLMTEDMDWGAWNDFHDLRYLELLQELDLSLDAGESTRIAFPVDTSLEYGFSQISRFDTWNNGTPVTLVIGGSGQTYDLPPELTLSWESDLTVSFDYRHLYLPWATPIAPTLSGCGEEQTVTIPAVEGLIYSEPAREGNLVTVTAEALEGWAIKDTESTSWTLTLDPAAECETARPTNYNLSVSHNEAIAAVDTVLVNVHALDENGEPESDLGDVHVQSTFGEISAVEMIEPGLFQATLVSHVAGDATVTFTVDDVDGEQSEQVTFVAADTTAPATGTTDPATGGGLPATGSTFPVLPVTLGALGLAVLGGLAFAFRRQTPQN